MNACNVLNQESFPSFVALIRERAKRLPAQSALGFMTDDQGGEIWRTIGQLDEEARAIGARLQGLGHAGRRALLLYGPGLEFVAALLGCFYGGVVAVPVCLPRPRRTFERLELIAEDSGADLVLTAGALLPANRQRAGEHPRLNRAQWLATDDRDLSAAVGWEPISPCQDDVACIQYTSGSATEPKGVVLTHGNLLFNSRLIYDAFGHGPESVGLIWLPHYHDMGLIGGILQPLFGAFPNVLMSPFYVIQQPLRWLSAISERRATTSGGPNFIYELCVQRVDSEACQGLDLSSWQVAFNGAEPIRPETLERFATKFAPYGFRREAFFPCYGLAEATLFVSGGPKASRPAIERLRRTALESHQVARANGGASDVVEVVGCGNPAPAQRVAIVDPESLTSCPENRVGEIWVSGPSIARGYWNRPNETNDTFLAHVANNGDARYLRTGDLGFLKGDQLFVTGRLKDLLIIDGRNYYPQDIELTVEKCDPSLRFHSGAAFTTGELDGGLTIVQEVERNGRGIDPTAVFAAIRRAVADEHELSVEAIALVKTGGVPKTTSGKIRRRHCRKLFLEGELPIVAHWRQEAAEAEAAPPSAACNAASPECVVARDDRMAPSPSLPDAETIQAWLVERIARRVQCEPGSLDVRRPFAWYGLQSRDALELSGELEIRLGRRLSPTLLYDCPTIESLASHVARETTAAQSDVPPAPRVTAASLEPIAIVGIGCRFPGAAGPAAFWQLLVDGVDAVREVPSDRWDAAAADGMLAGRGSGNGRATVRWGGWLADIDRFDSEFFGISPREAACIDPQQRLLLEVAWEALEDAGLPAERLRGSAGGVFVGISTNDYRQAFAARTSEVDPYWSTGNAGSIAANRLSYFFDLRGPSIAIDTACSSSLVAVHLAAGSLRNGECDVALAGGVNAILTPDISFSFAKGGGLAPDGRCKAFDSRADGIVRSEGVGIVVLKRLSDAMADGDSIYAVIRGSAVNQDGRSNGITAPNQAAQEAVLRSAWRSAGISPTEAQTIETHGAGTLLGDVIEANALMAVLAPGRTPDCPCAIGSVKTNIGHCEAAAGAAGLIKLALAIRHGRIPRSLHFKEPNPHIPFCEAPLAVQTETVDWPGPRDRRLAGVSSFGFGGTNAHVVLESPPPARVEPVPAMSGADAVHLLPLSAANMDALQALARRLDERLAAGPAELVDLCCEAATRRTHLDHRAALRFCSIETLREQLRAVGTGQGHPAVRVGRKPGDRRLRFAYVFSGHGGQWRGMHRPLWERFPAFRARLEECDRLVRQQAGWSVLTELDADPARSGMERGSVEVVQTTLLAMQLAMVEAWKSWGIEPDAVAGHSMGEIAAACAAGALDVGDAVRVVVARSRALEEALSGIGDCGGMAALRISGDEAEELIQDARDRVWISVHNSPNYTVLSGDRAILEELVAGLRHRKIGARMMDVPGAAHTPLLEPAAGRLRAALEGLTCRAEVVPFYSTLTGARRDGRELNAAYWADSICRPVRFAATIRALVQSGCRGFLEIGPHPMLTAAVAQCMEPLGVEAMVGPSLRRGDRDLDAMLGSFGALYAAGVDVDWQRIYPGQGRWASLPAYPWQRQRCWIDALPARAPGPPSAMAPADGNGRGAEPGAPERPIGPSPRPAPHGLECVVPASASARQVLEETEPGKRQKGLEAYLQAQIAYTLNTDPARIDVERSLTTMGIDSLMGIEIKNRVEAELGVAVSLVQFLEGPTIARLADAVLPQLDRHASSTELAKDQAASGTNGGEIADEEAARLLERLEQLSDEEVDALTQRMLAE